MGQHERQQADRKRWNSAEKLRNGLGGGYRQLVTWEYKISRAKVCLTQFPLSASDTDESHRRLSHGTGAEQTRGARYCCSPSLNYQHFWRHHSNSKERWEEQWFLQIFMEKVLT